MSLWDALARLLGWAPSLPSLPTTGVNSLNTRATAAPPPHAGRSVEAGPWFDKALAESVVTAPPDRFAACLPLILAHEGGYVDHPKDPGGATNMGITLLTLAAWRGRNTTKDDVRALTKAEAAAIYRARYWDVMACGTLPPGIDLMVFDFGVNSGPGRATRMLQAAIGATIDGVIGPKTLLRVQAWPAEKLIDTLATGRLDYLKGLGNWPVFGKGWARRVEETRAKALAMAAGKG